jgi:hypothetical protein
MGHGPGGTAASIGPTRLHLLFYFTRAAHGPKLLSCLPFFLSEGAALAIAIAAVSAIQPPCPEPAGAVTDENGAHRVQKNPLL